MRQLLARTRCTFPDVTEEVYLSEYVRCHDCQITVPMGIEVVTFKNKASRKEVLKHRWYCRVHGAEYIVRAMG